MHCELYLADQAAGCPRCIAAVGDSVAAVAKRYQQLGLPVHFISRQLQCQHAAAGITAGSLANTSGILSVGDNIQHEQLQPSQKLPIGVMRTLLQLHLAAMVDGLPDSLKQKAVLMVLDDDKRLLRRSTGGFLRCLGKNLQVHWQAIFAC